MAAYSVYLMSYRSYQRQSQSAELTQNGRIALERMSREIRQANDILTVLPESQGTGTASEIKFQDGHDTTKIEYIRYYLSGTDLYRQASHYCFISSCTEDDWVLSSTTDGDGDLPQEYPETPQIKAQKISNLQFWKNSTVGILLSVSDSQTTYTFETKILPRNL